jgi:monothiol glutaredoxin
MMCGSTAGPCRSKKYKRWPTFPQLYVNGELVGGCDIVIEMYKSGELKQLLSEAGVVAA